MPDGTFILKTPQLTPDQDYAWLRSKGLAYIEELGSRLWTDYNEHDPGITILETLCYAITDLGYRTVMPMQNLLADDKGHIPSSQTLFTAQKILTQAPLTVNDYRKLLVDIPGIHNAWLFFDDFYTISNKPVPAGETPLFADCAADALSFSKTPHPVYLRGLYKVLLDLENNPQFGDLNNGDVIALSPAAGLFKAGDVSFTVSFAAWSGAPADLFSNDVAKMHVPAAPAISADGNNWKIVITYTIEGDAVAKTLAGSISVDLEPAGRKVTLADVQAFFSTAFTQQVFNLYVLKVQAAKDIVQIAVRTLHNNRNLCEDFVSVTTIQDEEVAICCDIDVKPGADMEEVQAKVFYAIEEYLNPTVKFYLLKELLNKGYTVDEIFEGPRLEHGFVDAAQLEETQLRSEIYTSDIINLVMDIEGVLAVKNFRITKYDDKVNPVPGLTGKSWCMPVTAWHKPVFSETKSKIVFYKNQFPYLPSLAEVRDTMRWLHAAGMRNKLTGHATDIALPAGSYMALDSYTSVQTHFPQAYGIGQSGLPAIASNGRKAQAKQLKAYLMFYDQLLADFLSQLKNAGSLFSTDAIVQTYYAQFLEDIKDITPIYKQGVTTSLKNVLQNQSSVATPANAWQKLYEDDETFIDRRNRFLDHLMARFAESFNDYVMLMYSLDYETQQETQVTPAAIINSKIDFLKNYPNLSYTRASAYNYCPQKLDNGKYIINAANLWDTANVSGLEKKASFLGGIQNYTRRFLYCISQAQIIALAGSPVQYQYQFKNSQGDVLTSTAKYNTRADAEAAVAALITFAMGGEHYKISGAAGSVIIQVGDGDGNVIAQSNTFTDDAAAAQGLQLFMDEFNTECNSTGLHLIEHILLRPRDNSFKLAPVCLDPACDFCGEQDPYSFRISVVLPYWPKHFRSMAYRQYFEEILRREAPAHTTVKVCWVDNTAMYNFDKAYKAWVEALANYTYTNSAANLAVLKTTNDALLTLLFTLHSQYPVAALHDCEESKDTNPVMLGKTILGSIKN